MGKLLSWLLLIAIGYLVFKLAVVIRRKSVPSAGRRANRAAAPLPDAETMVQCTRCGVHLPRSEALLRDDRPYCSAEHRDAG